MARLFEAGVAALRQGRAEEALAHFAEAIRRTPADHRARLMAARAMGEMGERERALLVLHDAAEGLLRRDYLLTAAMAIKLALRFNPSEKMLKNTLRRIHARARAFVGKGDGLPPPIPPEPRVEGPVSESLIELRGGELVERALEVLLGTDDGPAADHSKRPPLPLFAELDAEAFVDLVERMTLKEIPKGAPMMRKGEEGRSVFVIISGKAQVVREGDDGQRQVMASLTGGALVGELSALIDAPRSATVYASDDVELFEIDRDDLEHVSQKHPSVLVTLAEFAQKRLAKNLLGTAPLFAKLEPHVRTTVLQRFSGRVVGAGECVISEGEPSPGLFLVLSGEFSVTKKDEAGQLVSLRVLGDGEVFGEISLLSGGPASASVTAIRKSATAFLPQAAYDEFVRSFPGLEEFLMDVSQRRLSANAIAVQVAEVMDAEELIVSS